MEVRNEDDLLLMLYKEKLKSSYGFKVFPKVSEIPKGKENAITPDIDLLEVRPRKQIETAVANVIGYEVKFLRYRKKSKSFNLSGFYKGLGQVLCYFQHGVQRAYLVIGLSEAPKDIIEKTKNHIQKIWEFLENRFSPIKNYVSIEIRSPPYEKEPLVSIPPHLFPVTTDKDIKHKHSCLIRLEFTWAKKWLSKMEKKVKEKVLREWKVIGKIEMDKDGHGYRVVEE